jgi:pantoate--beta-alanine ligase
VVAVLHHSLAETQAACRKFAQQGLSIGFVPTMGALHAGHGSLISRAARENDVVVVSDFVNPLQFGDPSDLRAYPRDLDGDVALASSAGATVVCAPQVHELYPTWPEAPVTMVSVGPLAEIFEGAARPGHFNGVATVVTKLHNAVRPTRAYYGEKDFQQLAVIRQITSDLSPDLEIIGCTTEREADGLAMSSRNVRLSAEARVAARGLSRALHLAGQAFRDDLQVSAEALNALMATLVLAGGDLVTLDYAVVIDASTFARATGPVDPTTTRCLITAIVGGVRLLDNADLMFTLADEMSSSL